MVNEFSVFGSCASRNIFNSNLNDDYKKSFHINYSVESSSIISLMSQPLCFEKKLIDSDSDYYNECVNEDCSKNFLDFLKNDQIDFLILDTYFDASAQIIVINDDTYITETLSLRNQSLFPTLNEYPRINVYSTFEKYFPIFKSSCNNLFKFVKENCNDLKIILNCSRSVYKYMKNGNIIENPDFKNSNSLNKCRNVLDKYILENFDVEILPFDMDTLYDATYIFGVHHTHYEPRYFKDKTIQLNNIIKKTETYGWNDPLYSNYRENMRKVTTLDWHKQELENKINNLNNNLHNLEETFSKVFYKYNVARIDIKNECLPENNIEFLHNSDIKSEITQPSWFKDEKGIGTKIQTNEQIINLKIKCINDGNLRILLRGIDIREEDNRIPIYIRYTSLKINDIETIMKPILTCHDTPHIFEKKVKNSEVLDISISWEPF